MKTLVIHDATDLATLAHRMNGENTLESLKRLNPHLDPARVPAHSLVLVEGASTHEGAQSPWAPQVQTLAAEMKAALHAAVAASMKGLELRAKERRQVADALRVPAMKRVVDADPDLKSRATALAEVHRKELARDKATEKALRLLQSCALAEVDGLLKSM